MKREIVRLGNERLLAVMRELTDQRPTYGYRRITALLRCVRHSNRRNGEQLQVVFSIDCYDRETITSATSTRGLDSELIRDLMTETIENRFGKVDLLPLAVQWLSENGPR